MDKYCDWTYMRKGSTTRKKYFGTGGIMFAMACCCEVVRLCLNTIKSQKTWNSLRECRPDPACELLSGNFAAGVGWRTIDVLVH